MKKTIYTIGLATILGAYSGCTTPKKRSNTENQLPRTYSIEELRKDGESLEKNFLELEADLRRRHREYQKDINGALELLGCDRVEDCLEDFKSKVKRDPNETQLEREKRLGIYD